MPTLAPPDVPPMPRQVPHELVDYLRRLNSWALQEIDKKAPKDEAIPHLILSAADQKDPTKVFAVTVNSAGALTATAVPLGRTGSMT